MSNVHRPYLTLKEINYIIQKTDNPRDQLLMLWLSRTGIRITELLQLRMEHIDFSQRTVAIIHQKQKSRLKCPKCSKWVGKSHQFCPACGGELIGAVSDETEATKRRTIPVDIGTLQFTQRYMGGRKSGLIFNITRQRADQIVKEAAQRVGIVWVIDLYNNKKRRMHAHIFRHSFAMYWIEVHGRSSMEELQSHLGHADIKTTHNYLHWSPQEIHKPYDKLWQ